VVLNRCLQFAPDPLAALDDARARVAPGGALIVTGLQFFRDATEKARSTAAYRDYLAQHGLEFIRPTKAYLDEGDRVRLAAAGLRIAPYAQLARQPARVQPRRLYAYGWWRAEDA
jgi:hypothetical protein